MSLLVLFALIGCSRPPAALPATRKAAPQALAPLPTLGDITWVDRRLHYRNSLNLRPDGTYTLVERVSYPRSKPTTQAYTGRWRVLSVPGTTVLDLGGMPTAYRIFKRDDQYRFDRVGYLEGKLGPDNRPSIWLRLSDDYHLCVYDLARYADETNVSAMVGASPLASKAAVPADFAAAVRRALPRGWSITEVENAILIADDTTTELASVDGMRPRDLMALRNGGWTFEQRYVLTLRFEPLMAVEELQQRRAANAAIEKVQMKMRDELWRIDHKGNLVPVTEEDRVRVAAYEKAGEGWQHLPEYHTATHTVYMDDSSVYGTAVVSGGESIESVNTAIKAMLTPYPPDEPSTQLSNP